MKKIILNFTNQEYTIKKLNYEDYKKDCIYSNLSYVTFRKWLKR